MAEEELSETKANDREFIKSTLQNVIKDAMEIAERMTSTAERVLGEYTDVQERAQTASKAKFEEEWTKSFIAFRCDFKATVGTEY